MEISKAAILVASKLKLKELQDNYPDVSLESTVGTLLDGGLENAWCTKPYISWNWKLALK